MITIEAALQEVSARVDAIAVCALAEVEQSLDADGWSADEIAAIMHAHRAEWIVWRAETLEQLRAWLTADTTVH